MRLTCASCATSTILFLRRFRFREADFLVRMWRLNALARRTLPVPVRRKRFLAPLFDFIFGIARVPGLERETANTTSVAATSSRHGRVRTGDPYRVKVVLFH